MSLNPSGALQKAVRDRLIGQTDAGSNVFDRAPAGNPFPRIMIGQGQLLSVNAGLCESPGESFLEIHVYDREVGFTRAQRIAGEVMDLLHMADQDPAFAPIGHRVVSSRHQTSRTVREADEKTAHVAMTFHVLSEPLA